jgi:hypothetical protein
MRNLTNHFRHYFSLIGILTAAVVAFVVFSYDRTFQIYISIAVAVSYVCWGIIHHYLHKDLYLEVVIEYLVVAVLGLIILFSLVFRV